jgi:hypothetical protein
MCSISEHVKLIQIYNNYSQSSKSFGITQGSPDTNLTFDFTGIDLEHIKKELPQKKKELDSKFNVDPQKSTIRIDDYTS